MTGGNSLTIGSSGNGLANARLLVENGGTFHSGTGLILVQNTGVLEIDDNGTFNANGNVTVDGTSASLTRDLLGVLNIDTGRTLTVQNRASVDITGAFDIDDGVTVLTQSGGEFNSGDLDVGSSSGTGTLTIQGEQSGTNSMGTIGNMVLGQSGGTGNFSVLDTASVTTGSIAIADDLVSGSTGVLTVDTGGVLQTGTIDIASGGGIRMDRSR